MHQIEDTILDSSILMKINYTNMFIFYTMPWMAGGANIWLSRLRQLSFLGASLELSRWPCPGKKAHAGRRVLGSRVCPLACMCRVSLRGSFGRVPAGLSRADRVHSVGFGELRAGVSRV